MPTYRAFYHLYESPTGLTGRLNEICKTENLELVTMYGDYFVLKELPALAEKE